jgi:hypothetical protein
MTVFTHNGKTVFVSRYVGSKSFKLELVYYNQELTEYPTGLKIHACRNASFCSSTKRAAKMINDFLGSEVAVALNSISVIKKQNL